MTFKKVQEPKQIGVQMVNGKEIPIFQPDNYVDWTSLSVVELDNINFSSRTARSEKSEFTANWTFICF